LEDSRAIGHTKEYYQEFEKFVVHIEDNLLLIIRLDPDIVKSLADI